MKFAANNKIVKLCTERMEPEEQRRKKEALKLFHQVWNEATNVFEKFIAAHYVARHQKNMAVAEIQLYVQNKGKGIREA